MGTAAIQTTSNRAWFGMDIAGIPGELQSVIIDSSAAFGRTESAMEKKVA